MDRERDKIALWIAREILPHEGAVRRWLSRRWRNAIDVDDVIQEAYCRIARLDGVDHIDNPAAYFHRAVHAVAVDTMRRAGIINFIPMTEIEWLNVKDHEPLADRAVTAKQELGRVDALLSGLSSTCRRTIEMRRIEGLSQRQTAERLGISEALVRNHLVRGLKKVLQTMAEQDADATDETIENIEQGVEFVGKRRSR